MKICTFIKSISHNEIICMNSEGIALFVVRRKLCIWVRVVRGIFVSGKWVIVLGTRIFFSACSSFCMQTRCEPQFYFIFLGGKSNYNYFSGLTGIRLYGFGRERKTPAPQVFYCRNSTGIPSITDTTPPQTSPPWWCRLPLLRRGNFGYIDRTHATSSEEAAQERFALAWFSIKR